MKVIILAAGKGSRLGMPHPKPLTPIRDGVSILDHQLSCLARYLPVGEILAVVGFRKDLIMRAHPELRYVFNPAWDSTNTSKSLLAGLRLAEGEGALWLNGDVVFSHPVISRLLEAGGTCMAVNRSPVGEEEVKYTLDESGFIREVSKSVSGGLGESVGVNLVSAGDVPLLLGCLEEVEDGDYFEKAVELAIRRGMRVRPVDIGDLPCVEVDFPADLARARELADGMGQSDG